MVKTLPPSSHSLYSTLLNRDRISCGVSFDVAGQTELQVQLFFKAVLSEEHKSTINNMMQSIGLKVSATSFWSAYKNAGITSHIGILALSEDDDYSEALVELLEAFMAAYDRLESSARVEHNALLAKESSE